MTTSTFTLVGSGDGPPIVAHIFALIKKLTGKFPTPVEQAEIQALYHARLRADESLPPTQTRGPQPRKPP